jgi:hypothetical protein
MRLFKDEMPQKMLGWGFSKMKCPKKCLDGAFQR